MKIFIGTLTTIVAALLISVGITNIKDNNVNISGDEIVPISSGDEVSEIPSGNVVSGDVININNFYRLSTESYAVKAIEVELISKYDFLKNIAKQNDLVVGGQLENYISQYIGQRYENYSKFQQNLINFYYIDDGEFGVQIQFSENEILGTWKENENKTFLVSTIDDEMVHIFEWQIPGSDYENECRAQCTVNGMNFVIKIIDASHEESMNIIKSTIREYKKYAEEKKKAGYIKIKDANLYSEGTSLNELVKYDDKLYGRAFSEIDYGGNPQGPIGVVDKLVSREYIPNFNGETNIAKFLNAKVDSATENSLILLTEEGAIPFERVYFKE